MMTQEEKQLLLKDLCGRLFYWPEITNEFGDISYIIGVENSQEGTFIVHVVEDGDDYDCVKNVDDFKPYLRPMSSMTEEERELYKSFAVAFGDSRDIMLPNYAAMDWLNKHHFDYRGLIPMGLALEAPDGMYSNNFKAGHEQVEKDLVGTILTEIERRRARAEEKYNESIYSMGRCDAYAEMRNFIYSVSDPL